MSWFEIIYQTSFTLFMISVAFFFFRGLYKEYKEKKFIKENFVEIDILFDEESYEELLILRQNSGAKNNIEAIQWSLSLHSFIAHKEKEGSRFYIRDSVDGTMKEISLSFDEEGCNIDLRQKLWMIHPAEPYES